MSKKLSSKKSNRKLFLFPIYLYFGIYFLSLLIAILNGGRPVLLSLLTNNFQDNGIRMSALRNAGVFYNVATKEIEDCDTNPMEYYPDGYVDATREYGRGMIYAYDMYSIHHLGMPARQVGNGINCLENSQNIVLDDIEGKHELNFIVIDYGLQDSTSPEGIQHTLPYTEQNSYNSSDYFFEIQPEHSFSFGFGCLSISGMYQLEEDKLLLSNIEKRITCPEGKLSHQQERIVEAFPTTLSIDVAQTRLQLSNDENGLAFIYQR